MPGHQLLPPKFTIEIDDTKPPYVGTNYASDLSINRGQNSFTVTVNKNERLTPPTHFQDVRLFTFTSPQPLTHAPGDALNILATNPPDVVSEALQILNFTVDPDQPLRVVNHSSNPSPQQFVERLTLRTILTHHLDITAIPRRSFFTFCAAFTTDEFHKERLVDFTDPKYAEELFDYTTRPRRSILEVLQEFDTVKIPLEYLVEMVPRIKGRLFSIASSKDQYSGTTPLIPQSSVETSEHTRSLGEEEYKLDLLVAIVKYRTVIKRIRRGMCTRYMSTLQPGDKLSVTVTKGGLGSSTRQVKPHTPVVMVGPGTGVAPMRALVWERLSEVESRHQQSKAVGEESINQLKPAKTLLFFGCRGRDADYYFGEEWEVLQGKYGRELFEIRTAFSRDQEEKRYVQHLIKEGKEEVWKLVGEMGGVVYVCG
ncbi:hypothetical protein ABW20_dc0101588 [Dactylellina cionopaga]|nr:hypothetical protein ABW20_dc0101588 [Dactylellina cionopaga]